jgi:hypothetical protein
VDRPWVVAVAFSVSAVAAGCVLTRRAKVLDSRARAAEGQAGSGE